MTIGAQRKQPLQTLYSLARVKPPPAKGQKCTVHQGSVSWVRHRYTSTKQGRRLVGSVRRRVLASSQQAKVGSITHRRGAILLQL